jgi:hypothetical protein
MNHKNNNKHKKEASNSTLVRVQKEMALPRMSKSARMAERNSDMARIPEPPRTVIPGTVDKLIPSSPSQPDKAQIAIESDEGYRDLRIENSLTDEHGDEVKLKKGAHVEVTVTEDALGADPKAA